MKTAALRHRPGFTMIEMLTVITIIIILAGLVFAGTRFAKDMQKRKMAEIQIKLLSNACEEFYLDNGFYPGRGETTASHGRDMTKELYSDLYWDSNRDGSGPQADTRQKIYLSELDPESNKQGWTEGRQADVMILDPWGNEYRYRKGPEYGGFEIWSAGPDGRTSPNNPKHKDNRDDIRP